MAWIELVNIGLRTGVLFFPLVLGCGLALRHAGIVDVSIDGTVILAGIVAAKIWIITGSAACSILGAVVCGSLCSCLVATMIRVRIHHLLSGIIFVLAAHAVAVLWIGENIAIFDSRFMGGMTTVPWWCMLLVLVVGAGTERFYRSPLGLSIRMMGDGIVLNSRRPPLLLVLVPLAISGGLYGLGAGLLVHSKGQATTGAGFDYLLAALPAYLAMQRLVDVAQYFASKLRRIREDGIVRLSDSLRKFFQIFQSVASIALAGSLFFHVTILLVISASPSPAQWKLFFALVLFMAVAKPEWTPMGLNFLKTPFANLGTRGTSPLRLMIKELNVVYDIGQEQRVVFRNATALFEEGINFLKGSNGAGKSTLLSSICGLLPNVQGSIELNGDPINQAPPYRRPAFFVHQNPLRTVSSRLSVAENLQAAAPRNGIAASSPEGATSTLFQRLAKLRIEPIVPVAAILWSKQTIELSGGQIQCVAIYCALLSDAPILCLDEPFTGLDPLHRREIIRLVKALSTERIVILTSHDSLEAEFVGKVFQLEHFGIIPILTNRHPQHDI